MLLRNWQRGQDVEFELYGLYFERLMNLGRTKLATRHRRVEDEEDLAQQVLEEFFASRHVLPEIHNRRHAWNLLVSRLRERAANHVRKYTAAKRGSGNVMGESAFVDPTASSSSPGIADAAVDGRLPEDRLLEDEAIAALNARLLNALDVEELKKIGAFFLQGMSKAEIAELCDIAQATVYRKLKIIKSTWACAT
jgi:RNA polymerase sigma factor (sigma-70 family)